MAKELKKCNVTVGRFQPFTEGHMKMVEAGYKENELPCVILQIPNTKNDAKHPFTDELIKEEIKFIIDEQKKANHVSIAGHFYVKNADIAKIAQTCHENGFEPVMWLCGSDRYQQYSKQADTEKYKVANNMLMEFKAFEVKRTDDDTSATKVRQAIKDDDFTTYMKMMPQGFDENTDIWEKFKKELSQIKEGMKSISKYLSESLKIRNNMKKINIYIKESLEDKSTWLIETFDQAKQYFEKYPKILDKLKLKIEDIEVLYKIVDENNITSAPIVGNYNNRKTGIIALRRYVEEFIDDWQEKSNNKNITHEWYWTTINGVYAGPHNTALGKNSSYTPSSEDMELIIAAGFNNFVEFSKKLKINFDELSDALKYAMGKSNPTKINKILEYIASPENNHYITNIIQSCNDALSSFEFKEGLKMPLKKCKNEMLDKRWIKAGSFTKNSLSIPKTDLMSENGVRISLKKMGGSQLTSATYNDTKALFMLCAKDKRSKLSEDEIKEIEDLFEETWIRTKTNGGVRKNHDNDNIQSGTELNNKLNETIQKYLSNDKYKDFRYSLLWEAITGDKKFGKDSNASAHYVLVWTDKYGKESKIYKIKEYINKLADEVKFNFSWKTGGNDTSYQVFRIVTK